VPELVETARSRAPGDGWMPAIQVDTSRPGWSGALDRLAAARPDVPLIAPLIAYLALLGLVYAVPPAWQPVVITVRGGAALAVAWCFRRHLPAWGKPYWPVALVGGAVVAWGWVVGQHLLEQWGWGGRLPLIPGAKVVADPRDQLGAGSLFWTTWGLRMIVACTAVPVAEELFWRAFLLRALIDWHDFERVPLGTFTWVSFLGTSVISTLQHPDNWGVSILSWMVFNAVFYWTRSILCLVLLHGFTNLVLYLIVLRVGDWSFW
jgi:CAAX prenyl protease-like protein